MVWTGPRYGEALCASWAVQGCNCRETNGSDGPHVDMGWFNGEGDRLVESIDERLMRDKKKDESAHITDLTPLHVRNLRARTPNLENCICIMHFVHTS